MIKTIGTLKNIFITASLLTIGLCNGAAADTYLLNPGDQLDVSVWNEFVKKCKD